MSNTNQNHHGTLPEPSVQSPGEILRGLFLSRKDRNPAYSQSAFARDLGVSVTVLSRVLGGARPMSLKFALNISTALGLSDQESNALLYSVLKYAPKKAKISNRIRKKLELDFSTQTEGRSRSPLFTTVEIEHFKAISQWYNLAILNLTTIDGFRPDPVWIAESLGISKLEASEALDRLVSLGLLREQDGRLQRANTHFYIKTQRSEAALRHFHSQMIERAKDELRNTDQHRFQNRLINSITFTCGPEHIEAIKDRIDQCQDDILKITSTGQQKRVYQFNVQFFPLSRTQLQTCPSDQPINLGELK